MNTTIYLIRHGGVKNPDRIIYGRTAISLSIEGKRQMKKFAEKLKKQSVIPDIIFSSPMLRTVESAKEIKKVFINTPIKYEDDLQEVDLGKLTGKQMIFLALQRGEIYTAKEFMDMGIEKPENIIKRMLEIITKIRTRYSGKTVFVISHGDPLAFLMWKLLHPKNPLPPMLILRITRNYLKKGTAWEIVFNAKGKILSRS